jgi:hypothetical protein
MSTSSLQISSVPNLGSISKARSFQDSYQWNLQQAAQHQIKTAKVKQKFSDLADLLIGRIVNYDKSSAGKLKTTQRVNYIE